MTLQKEELSGEINKKIQENIFENSQKIYWLITRKCTILYKHVSGYFYVHEEVEIPEIQELQMKKRKCDNEQKA